MLVIKSFGKGHCQNCNKKKDGATIAYFAGQIHEDFLCYEDLKKFLKGVGNDRLFGSAVMNHSAENIDFLIGKSKSDG